MFFRFYILGILITIFFLFTSVWAVSFMLLMWFLLILFKALFNYKKFKRERAIFYSHTLSFCIKSMKKQKQNFKIINFVIRQKSIQVIFKKLSILLDDINVKKSSNFTNNVSISDHKVVNKDHYYSPSYSGYSFNIHNKSD